MAPIGSIFLLGRAAGFFVRPAAFRLARPKCADLFRGASDGFFEPFRTPEVRPSPRGLVYFGRTHIQTVAFLQQNLRKLLDLCVLQVVDKYVICPPRGRGNHLDC